MADLTFSQGLDKLLSFLNYKETKRKELFKSEFEDFCEQYLIQKRYLISQIDLLIRTIESKKWNVDNLLKANDVIQIISEFIRELEQVLENSNRLRQEDRDKRIAIYKIAKYRSSHEYYENRIINLLSTEEADLFKKLFYVISESFEIEERRYNHELFHALEHAKYILFFLRKAHQNPSREIREELLTRISDAGALLREYRDMGQETSASVAALRDQIRITLTGV